jgi:PmbA protein
MRDELLARAREAAQIAREAGAQEALAEASRSHDVAFAVRDGKLEQVSDATSRQLAIRVYVDGRSSVHDTNDLRPDAVRSFVAEAVALTRVLAADPHRKITDPALYQGQAEVDLELVDESIPALSREHRLAMCEAQQAELRGRDKVISATSSVSDRHELSAVVASNGFEGTDERTSLWLGSEVTLQDAGDRRPEGSFWGGAARRSDVPGAAAIAQEALARAQAMLGAQKGPTKRATLVVEALAAPRILGQMLGAASGQMVQQGRSFWGGRLGEALFSERLTVTDDPLIPRGMASRRYDGEGIASKPMPLIEAGVPRNLYLSTYYASKTGLAPTTGQPSNRVVALGEQDLEALIAGVDDGYLVTGWLGGNADLTTGDFSLGCRGHLIVKGQRGAPVTEMNVTGNLRELFAGLVALGNDPHPYSTLRSPSLVFEGVQFSGA